MPRRPLKDLTPKEAEARREYMKKMKAESRQRAKKEGLCSVRSAVCEVKAKPGGSTCYSCDALRQERAIKAAEVNGWDTPPSKRIPRLIRKLGREGRSVKDIVRDSYLIQYEVNADEVRRTLKKAGLL